MKQRLTTQKFANVLIGSLESLTDAYWIECLPFESCSRVNNVFFLHTVIDILRQLCTKRESFALFLTDAARYMCLALCPSLMHVACIAHSYYIIVICECVSILKNNDDVAATV